MFPVDSNEYLLSHAAMLLFHFLIKFLPDTYLSSQFKKPRGLFGKFILGAAMDMGNAELHNFTLEQMNIQPKDSILEIGFGTGKILNKILASTVGFTAGIDFSKDMVEKASKLNAAYIKNGRLDIRLADVSKIPFKTGTFDKVYTANTLYFWPDPVNNAKEIMRVLKKNGKLFIAFRLKEELNKMPLTDTNFTKYSGADLKKLFKAAGYSKYQLKSRSGNGPFPSHTAVITK